MTNPIRLDATAEQALRDQQTVTTEGVPVAKVIDGVRTVAPVNHVDHRGRVFEIFPGANDFWVDPVVYCYAFTVRAHQVKGWGLHREKDDRYTLIAGELLTILFDARLDSPTHGLVQKVALTPQGVRQLLIPTGVWHMNVNLGEDEVHLVNHPTQVYDHANPDRLLLPWDAPEIPVELREVLPVQYVGSTLRDCH